MVKQDPVGLVVQLDPLDLRETLETLVLQVLLGREDRQVKVVHLDLQDQVDQLALMGNKVGRGPRVKMAAQDKLVRVVHEETQDLLVQVDLLGHLDHRVLQDQKETRVTKANLDLRGKLVNLELLVLQDQLDLLDLTDLLAPKGR